MLARKQVCHRLGDGEFVVGLRKEPTPTGQRALVDNGCAGGDDQLYRGPATRMLWDSLIPSLVAGI